MTDLTQTLEARQAKYGSPVVQLTLTDQLFMAWLQAGGEKYPPGCREAMHQILNKASRLATGVYHEDAMHDTKGYADCFDQCWDADKAELKADTLAELFTGAQQEQDGRCFCTAAGACYNCR